MWYNNYPWKTYKFWLNILYTSSVFWLVCILPGLGEILYLLRRRESISHIAEGEMYTYFKIMVFWCNKSKILNILKFMHCIEFKPVEEEHKKIIRKTIKTARIVMNAYTTMCVGAVSVGILLPLTENFVILPTNVEYPFVDVYKSPAYGLIYLHHIYYKPATCIIDGVMDTMLAAFIASAIGQIEILSFNLRNFKVLAERQRMKKSKIGIPLKNNDTKNILKKCIKHHNAILRYVTMIENAFSLASALQFMLSVMVLCLVGVHFFSIENPSSHCMQIMWMAVYLKCMLTEVFILCWFGNELILKSLELRNAAFDSPWVDEDRETKLYIIIFMERCKRPLIVTAGKIFSLSLSTYTNLINWSYKVFAVMRNAKVTYT
ncbi:odorant receptor 46a-like [Battus philenor]|uniref:odorant receptor 46a-like n=1 Tax=Battus philenor TaxID=42288 RepID=UPI0035CFAFD3